MSRNLNHCPQELHGYLIALHPESGLMVREDGAVLTTGRATFALAKYAKWTYGSSNGRYLQIQNNGKTWLIHRLMLEAFKGKDQSKTQCDHINRDKTDNRLSNLRWVTPEENMNNRKCSLSLGIKFNRADRKAYDNAYSKSCLTFINEKGQHTRTGFLTEDIYKQLKDLSMKDRCAIYRKWKEQQNADSV